MQEAVREGKGVMKGEDNAGKRRAQKSGLPA